MADRGLSFQ